MSQERSRPPHFAELVWHSEERELPIPPREEDGAGNGGEAASGDKALNRGGEALSGYKESNRGAGNIAPANPLSGSDAGHESPEQLELWEASGLEENSENRESGGGYGTTESLFVQRARELERHTEPLAEFVPFKSYWPTYGHMTGRQNRWYFYWRSRVREGEYLPTDLSYIFLHVYELINGVGWADPEDGRERLIAIWDAYRETYKRLDHYLGGWIADFCFVHSLQPPLGLIIARSKRPPGDLEELELMRGLSGDPSTLSLSALSALSDYEVGKSRFYTGEGREAMERYLPKTLALLAAWMERKHGKPLLELYPPGEPVMRERFLFRSAVYDISLYGYSVLVPVVRITRQPRLRTLITHLFRLTENKLRQLYGFRGRLKGPAADPELEGLISRYLEREVEQERAKVPEGPRVTIDAERVERLRRESEQVKELLTVEPADGLVSAEIGQDAAMPGPVMPLADGSRSEDTAQEPPAAEWNGAPLESMADLQRRAMKEWGLEGEANSQPPELLYVGEMKMEPAEGLAGYGMPPADNSRNEDAEPIRGAADRGRPAEAGRDTPVGSVAPMGSDTGDGTPTAANPAGATSGGFGQSGGDGAAALAGGEWAALAAAMTDMQRRALTEWLLHGYDAFCRTVSAAGSLPDLLIDELNELAMDAIGDLLIDGNEILEEYADKLRSSIRG
ncbi:TerB N-terminal domain-containing protein [Paenibacillus sp. CN-4]|uniref:TerB N-terminal domain-containing protein n=1 Tax=Paenibacillus nanchangensis TaxID=3348343 RepID=UPI0039790658